MAVAVAMDPEFAPCGHCDCVDGISPIPRKWQIDGVLETSECPRRELSEDSGELIAMFRHYRNGFLWVAGGISDQPHVYLQAMDIIDTWSNKLRPK